MIPTVKQIQALRKRFGFKQLILVGWAPDQGTWVGTAGDTGTDAAQAADGGNAIKREVLKWAPEDCHAIPSRVAGLITALEAIAEKSKNTRTIQRLANTALREFRSSNDKEV